jgi:hypothetical protein
VVYGTFLWFSIPKLFNYKIKSHFEMLILLLAIVSIGFGILGGGDTTRIMMLGYPFVFISIILLLQKYNLKSWLVLFILSIPALRLESSIPDFSTDREAFSRWFVEKMTGNDLLFWLTLGLIMMLITYFVINKTEKTHRKLYK